MNFNNNQASLNNKENLAPSVPIGSITNLATHCNTQTGEAVNNQKKQKRDIGAQTSTTDAQRPTHHSQKRAPAAQTSTPSFNQSRDNVHEQQQKKLKLNEIDSEYMNLIRAHLDEFTVEENGIEFVTIGKNGTVVWKEFLLELNWNKTGSVITRELLYHLFDHKTLATRTLTGKPSLVFLDKNTAEKRQLNPLIVQDIIEFMILLKGMKARDVKKVINNVKRSKKFLRSLSANALVPPEANVTRKPETMFAVSTERNVISVPEAASSDSCERNVRMEPETVEVSSDSDSSEIIVI